METQDLSFLDGATGPIPYSLRNDLMFKVVLQENPTALKEMQMENETDRTQRFVYYLCANHTHLNRGEAYKNVKPTVHIGILDFNLFPEGENEFYAECAKLTSGGKCDRGRARQRII